MKSVEKVLAAITPSSLPPVFKISNSKKIEYGADVFNADHPAQVIRFTGVDHVQNGRSTGGEGRCMNDVGSSSLLDNMLSSGCLSPSLPVVNSKLAGPLYLLKGFLRHAVSKTVGHSEVDWASLVKDAHVQFWSEKVGTPVTNTDVVSLSQVLGKTLLSGKLLFFSDRMIIAISCCIFSVQHRALQYA